MPHTVLAKIQTVIQRYNKGYPFQYAFVDDQFNARFQTEELMAETARTFAILAILISCLGLFGLAAYSAEQRTREIGIRKVLGASVAGIMGLLLKDFLQLVGICGGGGRGLADRLGNDCQPGYPGGIGQSGGCAAE
jgi:putative ABC transport system permease protein